MNSTHQVLAYADDVNLIGDDIRKIERNADVLLNACKDICLAVQRHHGRPGTRWADVFKKVAGIHWTRIAGNRNEWRHLGDTSNTRTRKHQYHPATIDVQQGQAVNQ